MRLLVFCMLATMAWASPPQWRSAAPGYVWQFPADLARHPDYKTEWWYITGHLQPQDDPEAAPLSFQLTFFRVGLTPALAPVDSSAWSPTDLVMAHAAMGDPATGKHVFSEVIHRATPFLGGFGAAGDTTLAWVRAPAGTDAAWSLRYREGTFCLTVRDDRRNLRYELQCAPTRPRLFHGEGGFSPKTQQGDAGSLYFSRTRMGTRGTVLRAGQEVPVVGSAWLDREIFTSTLADQQVGWDWFSLNLDDGTDLMLYRLRNADGQEDFALGTRRRPDGTT
ncbi:MAG: carotenoid 1,2-hydratase, partial [Proteobacteria bacterium]